MASSLLKRTKTLLPLAGQLEGYGATDARHDLVAGLTLAALLIPQCMAYAMLAGLPPVLGLYASTVPLIAYAMVGSSRYLSVGPVALVAVVIAGSLSSLAEPGSSEFVSYAVVLGLLVGGIQLLLGGLRLGAFVDLLGRPVTVGFTAGAAALIAAYQLPSLLGVDVPRFEYTHELLAALTARIGEVDLVTLGLGAACIATLVVLKTRFPKVPRALVVAGLATAGVAMLDPSGQHVAILGEVPSGLPAFALPDLGTDGLSTLLTAAVLVVLVSFVEAYSVAKVTAAEDGEEVDANRELSGLGFANLASAFFGGMPVGGAFSRTAVNKRAGARTSLSVLLAGVIVFATLLWLTPLLRPLPLAALSAIIIVAVAGLVDVAALRELWRLDRRELGVAMVTGVATFTLGVGLGIAIGVGLSLARFIQRKARPAIVELGRLPGTEDFHDVRHHDDAEDVERLLMLRPMAPAFFANARAIRDAILELVSETDVDAVIVDAAAIPFVDSTGARRLLELEEELETRDVELHIGRLHRGVTKILERAGLLERLGPDRVHRTLSDAVEALAA